MTPMTLLKPPPPPTAMSMMSMPSRIPAQLGHGCHMDVDMDSDSEQDEQLPGCQDDDDAAIDVEADEEPANDCGGSRPPTAPPAAPPVDGKLHHCPEVPTQLSNAPALDKSISHKATPHSY
ncbi:hypothetical protein ACLKA7_011028 [Drosophila subpalustris]